MVANEKRPAHSRFVDGPDSEESVVPDKNDRTKDDDAAPKGDEKPHKVDEQVQEDAAKERAENEGYD